MSLMVRRGAQVVATLAAGALVLSGCGALGSLGSQDQGLPQDIGQWRQTNEGAAITVPALWAGKKDDGTPVGGIEPAEIVVSTDGDTAEYEVNLADIEAEGAGPSWLAATSVASAFATVFVGANPSKVDLYFEVTGPIDGPSAGGILTVGLIAAFRGDSLSPTATMTGTITADGTIGPVGGVPTKIEAAAREGFKTIVLPDSLAPGTWQTGNEYTELADSLAVEVVPVETIGEAYDAMSGNPVQQLDESIAAPFDGSVLAATRSVTEQIVASFEQAVAVAEENDSAEPDTLAWAKDAAAAAGDYLAAGDYSKAYGTAAFGLARLARSVGAIYMERLIASQGLEAAKAEVAADARELLGQAEQALEAGSKLPVDGLEQYYGLPTALGWATFAQLMMQGVLLELPEVKTGSPVIEMGRVIAEQEIAISLMLPLSLEVLAAVPTKPTGPIEEVSEALSGYSRFLIRAAQDSERYLNDVLKRELNNDGQYSNGGQVAAAVFAHERSDLVTPEVETYPQEVSQASFAMSYFWLAANAVASVQAYKVFADDETGFIDAQRQKTMNTAVDQTWWFIESRGVELDGLGVDASAAVWAARWAFDQSREFRDTPLATESDWFAQGELWFDAIHVMMLVSSVAQVEIETS